MLKKLQENSLSLNNLKFCKKINLLNTKNKIRDLDTSIPSREDALKIDKYLVKLHKWRKEKKQLKLQETYDENCRIFISLKKQKSQYKLQRKMTGKQSQSKLTPLPPLTERHLNRTRQQCSSKLISPRSYLTRGNDKKF